MTGASSVAEEVQALVRLDLEGLRTEWRRRYGPPPKLRSPELVRHLLAWKIQSDAFGGLSAETLRLVTRRRQPDPQLQPGARLIREWQGERHEVEVEARGLRYRDATYRTLSEVARKITGTRWNGPRFFGLRPPARDA